MYMPDRCQNVYEKEPKPEGILRIKFGKQPNLRNQAKKERIPQIETMFEVDSEEFLSYE